MKRDVTIHFSGVLTIGTEEETREQAVARATLALSQAVRGLSSVDSVSINEPEESQEEGVTQGETPEYSIEDDA